MTYINGHEWKTCTCIQCKLTRKRVEIINALNPKDICCKKCGTSKEAVEQQDSKTKEGLSQLNNPVTGLLTMFSKPSFYYCFKCSQIACHKCVRDSADRFYKVCPHCNTNYEQISEIGITSA